jgi:hypothetical protein
MRPRMPRLLVPVAATLLLAGCAAAGAATQRSTRRATPRVTSHGEIEIQQALDRAGNPVLVANAQNVGPHPRMTWLMCPPAGARCKPVTHGAHQLAAISQALNPGRTRRGTFFKAIASGDGHSSTARTSIWLGTVTALAAPRVSGPARVGARVRPIAGGWSGGWSRGPIRQAPGGSILGGAGRDRNQLSVEACRTASGRHCRNLSPQASGFCLYGPDAVRVPARFAGWYLFAFDQRVPHGQPCTGPVFGTPEAAPTVRPGPTASRSAALGPVRR